MSAHFNLIPAAEDTHERTFHHLSVAKVLPRVDSFPGHAEGRQDLHLEGGEGERDRERIRILGHVSELRQPPGQDRLQVGLILNFEEFAKFDFSFPPLPLFLSSRGQYRDGVGPIGGVRGPPSPCPRISVPQDVALSSAPAASGTFESSEGTSTKPEPDGGLCRPFARGGGEVQPHPERHGSDETVRMILSISFSFR